VKTTSYRYVHFQAGKRPLKANPISRFDADNFTWQHHLILQRSVSDDASHEARTDIRKEQLDTIKEEPAQGSGHDAVTPQQEEMVEDSNTGQQKATEMTNLSSEEAGTQRLTRTLCERLR
jgi:hypothetical protein